MTKKFFQFGLIINLFLIAFNSSAQVWTQKTNFPGNGRYESAFFQINNKGYVGTGYDGTKTLNDFWEYDSSTDTWTQKANFGGQARYGAVGFAVNGKGYIGLGNTSITVYFFPKDIWEYDTTANSWLRKNDFPGVGRYDAASFTIGDRAYMGTGYNQVAPHLKDFWQYNPVADTWIQKTNFGGTVRESTVFFAINNSGYIGCGATGSGVYTDVWRYDTLNNSWTQVANAPPRYGAVSFVYNNCGYFGFGSSSYPSVQLRTDFWKYDPGNNTWSQISTFPSTSRYHTFGFMFGCNFYVGSGRDSISAYLNEFWQMNFCSSPISNFKFNTPACLFDGSACLDFTNLSVNATSYQWSFPGATPSLDTAVNPKGICYFTGGVFPITLIVSNGSTTDTLTDSLTVYAPIVPSINLNGDTLIATQGFLSYQWYRDGNIINGATNYFYIATQPGNYSLEVTDIHGCSSTVQGLHVSTPQISNLPISIYFNSENHVFYTTGIAHTNISLQIFNSIGEQVYSKQVINPSEYLSLLSTGIYFVRLNTGDNQFTQKIIIQ